VKKTSLFFSVFFFFFHAFLFFSRSTRTHFPGKQLHFPLACPSPFQQQNEPRRRYLFRVIFNEQVFHTGSRPSIFTLGIFHSFCPPSFSPGLFLLLPQEPALFFPHVATDFGARPVVFLRRIVLRPPSLIPPMLYFFTRC